MNQNQLDAMYIIELFIAHSVSDATQRRELFDSVADFVEQPTIVNELNAQREVQS